MIAKLEKLVKKLAPPGDNAKLHPAAALSRRIVSPSVEALARALFLLGGAAGFEPRHFGRVLFAAL